MLGAEDKNSSSDHNENYKELSDYDNKQALFEFDIHQEIRDLINKLIHGVNLVFGIIELKFMDIWQMFGQIN